MTWTPGIASGPLVVAHRGAHGVLGPHENSLAAFQAAIAMGVDVLELDIRRTADGVLVVHHDPTLPDGRKLADVRYADLPPLADGQHIPRLRDVAALARRHGARVQAEFKETGYEPQALRELLLNMAGSRLDLISFHPSAIEAVERYAPGLRTGALEPRLPAQLRGTPIYPIARWTLEVLGLRPSLDTAERIGADYVSVEQQMVTPRFVRDAHARGIGVYSWTVNDVGRMAELARDGVDAIVTDRPDLALAMLGRNRTT